MTVKFYLKNSVSRIVAENTLRLFVMHSEPFSLKYLFGIKNTGAYVTSLTTDSTQAFFPVHKYHNV